MNTTFMRRARMAGLAGLAAAAVVLAGCAGPSDDAEDAAPAAEQVLRYGNSGEPQPIQAGLDQGNVGVTMDTLVHAGLVTWNKDEELVPYLAESYEQDDATTYTFTLREGLTFQDGEPLTSEDVAASLLYLAEPENGAKSVTGLSDIESVDTPDELTAVISLSAPNSAFLEYLADPTSAIYPAEALEFGAVAEIGAGPFQIEEKTAGVGMTLSRFDGFWNAEDVTLDTIEITYYPDATARVNALLAGEIDFMDFVPWADFERLDTTEGIVLDQQEAQFMYVYFNVVEGSPLSDPVVRRAVSTAIDRQSVIDSAFFGYGTASSSIPVAAGSVADVPEAKDPFEYDPDAAHQMLLDAGYADGDLTLDFTTSSQYAFLLDSALSIQADLEAIGITVNIVDVDYAAYQELGVNGEYDITTVGGAGAVLNPFWIKNYVTGPDSYVRSFGYNNEALNAALDAGLRGATPEEQTEGFTEAFTIINEDVPFTMIGRRNQAYAYTDDVTGFAAFPGFLNLYSGIAIQDVVLTE
ncbi:ABC transporter substrate-binding protein [Microbacterium tumbae]